MRLHYDEHYRLSWDSVKRKVYRIKPERQRATGGYKRKIYLRGRFLEARGGIEPPIKVLQTFALPLGDRAVMRVEI
jgi:hypothetical protein